MIGYVASVFLLPAQVNDLDNLTLHTLTPEEPTNE